MSHFNCRVCRAILNEALLLTNLPAVAQNLPSYQTLSDDVPVELLVYSCPFCGCVQLACDPVPYYREVIRASAVSSELREYKSKQFAEFIKKYNLKDKRIIEIGCGGGEFLNIINEHASNVFGTEYSRDLFEKCQRDGFHVFNIYVDAPETKITDFKFDAFVILNFIEHFPDPVSALRGIYNNLSDGAVGVIEVPNLDMILQKRIYSEFMRDHLFYYTAESLTNLLALCGFEVVERNSLWYDYVLSITVRKRKQITLNDIPAYRKQVGAQIQKVLDECNRAAVWGASHQALFLLTCIPNTSRLCYIIDSAPVKQGRYSPASHISIIAPPDRIHTDAIFVFAGGYSSEIVTMLHQKYKYAGKIYTLEGSVLIESKE